MNATKKLNLGYYHVLGLVVLGLSLACIRQKESVDSGSYLNVSVAGLKPGDENLEGIRYSLFCNQDKGPSQAYSVLGSPSQEDPKDVIFPDDKIKLGDTCVMEIRADAEQPTGTYEWLAREVDDNGEPTIKQVGLFYSSDKGTVEAVNQHGKTKKALRLFMYKTYTENYPDLFFVNLTANFSAVSEALSHDVRLLRATLECTTAGGKLHRETSRETIMSADAGNSANRIFVFGFPAGDMKEASCDQMIIFINNEPVLLGSAGIDFQTPNKGDRLDFGPVNVGPFQQSYGVVECSRNALEQCVAFELPSGAEAWMAVVRVRQNSVEKDMLVTSGSVLKGSAGVINHSIGQMLQAVQTSYVGYAWFPIESLPLVVGNMEEGRETSQNELDAQVVSSFLSTGVPLHSLASNFTPLYIKEVYVHGFKTVSAEYLNSFESARWFAHINLFDGLNRVGQVLVGGANKYFLSNQKQDGAFFNPLQYRTGNQLPGSSGYRTYQLRGSGLATSSCGYDMPGLLGKLNSMDDSQIKAEEASIEACEVTSLDQLNRLVAPDQSSNLNPRFYLWGWHRFAF